VPHSARVATLSLAELLAARERKKERKTNLTAMLKALLDDVVAKHVLHEGYGMRFHHLKHCHYLLWWGVCQLLLYKATAVLIPAEVMHITFDVLHHIVTVNSIMLIGNKNIIRTSCSTMWQSTWDAGNHRSGIHTL